MRILDNILSMNEFLFFKKTPPQIDRDISKRVAAIRKRRKISQKQLSERSGVSYGSIKRFETRGEISLLSLTKIAIALGIENELEELFADVPFLSIEEVMREED